MSNRVNEFKKDKRYTAQYEHCGQSTIRIVVRFCGELVGHCANDKEALAMMIKHKDSQVKEDIKDLLSSFI